MDAIELLISAHLYLNNLDSPFFVEQFVPHFESLKKKRTVA